MKEPLPLKLGNKKLTFEYEPYERFTYYADNEIYRQELLISLSDHDWCKLENQPFYHELIAYLDNL